MAIRNITKFLILMKFSNGAVFRSLITNLVLVFPKKNMADPKW
jgi:hypothetical protein